MFAWTRTSNGQLAENRGQRTTAKQSRKKKNQRGSAVGVGTLESLESRALLSLPVFGPAVVETRHSGSGNLTQLVESLGTKPQQTPAQNSAGVATAKAAKAATAGPTTTKAAIVYSGPIVITKGGTYTGNWQSLNANVPAVQIRTSQPVIIQNSNIRSRSSCIDVAGVSGNLTVRNTRGYGLNPMVAGRYPGRFLDVDGFVNLVAYNNYMENTAGIYVYGYYGNHTKYQTVKILRNIAKNIDGREADGKGGWANVASNPDEYKQFFQINGVHGLAAGEVAWNQIVNTQGYSRVEENINIHDTTGLYNSGFAIHDNYIQGAFPANSTDTLDYTGGGIMLSDNGSSYIWAYNNQIVATGHIGITITSGHDNRYFSNRIVSAGLLPSGPTPWSNVGAVIWNFNAEKTFTNNMAYNNWIGWVDSSGNRNDWWVPNASSFTGNRAWLRTVTKASEATEWVVWKAKYSTAKVAMGPTV